MNQGQFEKLNEVWHTWLQLSSRKEDWITEARNRCFKHSEAQDGMDLFLREIPKEHKKSASDWFANGILSPKESREVLPRENFTLTLLTIHTIAIKVTSLTYWSHLSFHSAGGTTKT